MWRVSYLLNWVTGGRIDELLCYRLHVERRGFWIWTINTIFRDPNHVVIAYRWQRREKARKARERYDALFSAEWEYDFSPIGGEDEALEKPNQGEGKETP